MTLWIQNTLKKDFHSTVWLSGWQAGRLAGRQAGRLAYRGHRKGAFRTEIEAGKVINV